ncbi:GxxExxY protein [Marinifilum caeruleilacunae]|uniref:GxxExxY protein n=1 Tax=Marinifilum caeruleilacunae TaxID=2499076 RepID=A0ABX1WTX4_9BACT|nr:GxxExxY protein [Marinifilum caeruleilacunae]NOU59550.1 GxxExxY protein [Marinifilum caeruleilacunae]
MSSIFFKNESYKIIGACMEVHNYLGSGFLEIVYKDALEVEFAKRKIPYEREKEYTVQYKGKLLPRKYIADFVVYDRIILEIKAVSAIHENYLAQALNYLAVSKERLALVVNFGESQLKYQRVIK